MSEPHQTEEMRRRDDRWQMAKIALNSAIVVIGFFLSTTLISINLTLREHDQSIQILKTQAEDRKESHEKEIKDVKEFTVNMAKELRESTASIAKELKESTAAIAKESKESATITSTRYEAWLTKLSEKLDHVAEKFGAK